MHTQAGTHYAHHIPRQGYSLQATYLTNYASLTPRRARAVLLPGYPPSQARIARATARKPVRLLIPVGGAGAQRTFVSKFVRATGAPQPEPEP